MASKSVLDALCYVSADTVNREGFPTFRHSLAQQALQVLLTGNLSDTFYAGRETVAQEAVAVLEAMGREDVETFARMIVYAREAGRMRLLPTLGTVVLASAGRPDLFARVFERVVTTPRELRDFIQLARLRTGMGRSAKRAIGSFLCRLSEYHLIKYGRATLRDAVRLSHARPRDDRERMMLKMVARGLESVDAALLEEHLPQVAAWRRLLGSKDLDQARLCVAEGRLPYEAVVGAVRPDRPLWRALMRQMPMLALLRHLMTPWSAAEPSTIPTAWTMLWPGSRMQMRSEHLESCPFATMPRGRC